MCSRICVCVCLAVGHGPLVPRQPSSPALLWFPVTALITLSLSAARCSAAARLASLTGLVGNNLVISNYSFISSAPPFTQRVPLCWKFYGHSLNLNQGINRKDIKQIWFQIWCRELKREFSVALAWFYIRLVSNNNSCSGLSKYSQTKIMGEISISLSNICKSRF